ncbi:MAG: hypothetical protein JEZ11_24080 [Desulfobacterales bacterium]|nr:hypothetical protein [Desulfobacterales bacterium]
MRFAKRNHYNPCFWTALWNEAYYAMAAKNSTKPLSPREQVVYALNVKSRKIRKSKVDDVHYDKNLGVAEISKEAAEEFAKKYHPDQYETFLLANENAEYPVYIDFEQILSELEKLPPYKVLLQVAQKGRIESAEEKAHLGCFVVIQNIRSHAIMNAMIQLHEKEYKFEHFVTLKWMLGDTDFLFSLVYPIVTCRWTLFGVNEHLFPLCDSPILIKPKSIMVALSPRLLLEIEREVPAREGEWRLRRTINTSKLNEFRRRTIGNTFREIIGNEKTLKKWKDTRAFRERVSIMSNLKNYNTLVRIKGNRELWHINAYSNQ